MSKAKDSIKKILSIPGLDADLAFDGSSFTITGKVPGDAYNTIKQALKEKKEETIKKEVTENE